MALMSPFELSTASRATCVPESCSRVTRAKGSLFTVSLPEAAPGLELELEMAAAAASLLADKAAADKEAAAGRARTFT